MIENLRQSIFCSVYPYLIIWEYIISRYFWISYIFKEFLFRCVWKVREIIYCPYLSFGQSKNNYAGIQKASVMICESVMGISPELQACMPSWLWVWEKACDCGVSLHAAVNLTLRVGFCVAFVKLFYLSGWSVEAKYDLTWIIGFIDDLLFGGKRQFLYAGRMATLPARDGLWRKNAQLF